MIPLVNEDQALAMMLAKKPVVQKTSGTKKKKYQTWNSLVLERIQQKFGFTKFYIRQCLRGDRNNETADAIQKEYKRLCIEVEQALTK